LNAFHEAASEGKTMFPEHVFRFFMDEKKMFFENRRKGAKLNNYKMLTKEELGLKW
jgi:hypothetical protein